MGGRTAVWSGALSAGGEGPSTSACLDNNACRLTWAGNHHLAAVPCAGFAGCSIPLLLDEGRALIYTAVFARRRFLPFPFVVLQLNHGITQGKRRRKNEEKEIRVRAPFGGLFDLSLLGRSGMAWPAVTGGRVSVGEEMMLRPKACLCGEGIT